MRITLLAKVMWQTHTHTHKQDKTTFLPFMPLNKKESPLLLSLIRSPLNIFYDTWHETNALLIIIITDKPFLTINIIMSCVCMCVYKFLPMSCKNIHGYKHTHTHEWWHIFPSVRMENFYRHDTRLSHKHSFFCCVYCIPIG